MTFAIRFARPDEASALSALALRSKGHWDYSADFLELCRDELTYTAEKCGSGDVFVAEQDGQILGFAALDGTPPDGDLEALFVDVGAMGRGVGGGLLQHVLKVARNRGFTSLTLHADPGAEPFYAHHGAIRIGEAPSGSIPGRTLPELMFGLT
ncbi:GNAT family N-acetyltransferase [Brevibacterium gallinarum]|uniref:GNAT family N-acetyltransferase n=1 Tax=Brevibacterium gallinarum TaxID=2762220 RepID=A0ABR8WW01_9MICO|nr:GNAT family N-acetyltransferase [Brevibacterium gallinarum]MBD8021265.1 GNAT family N-acetyltransferase [Brevibacterium gallinarum]